MTEPMLLIELGWGIRPWFDHRADGPQCSAADCPSWKEGYCAEMDERVERGDECWPAFITATEPVRFIDPDGTPLPGQLRGRGGETERPAR